MCALLEGRCIYNGDIARNTAAVLALTQLNRAHGGDQA